ncbi:MAG: phage protein NinX family protein [Porticoccaceae bacterium]
MANIKELSGPLLDCWVAFAEGHNPESIGIFQNQCVIDDDGQSEFSFEPSSAWHDGGPIIERGLISVYWFPHDSPTSPGHWEAFIRACDDDGFPGDTPLVAAMRAYLASKFGKETPAQPVFRTYSYRGPKW